MKMDFVTEIMVVGENRGQEKATLQRGVNAEQRVSMPRIYIERFGVIEDSNRRFPDDESLLNTINRIIAPVQRAINKRQPIVDARLKEGYRVNAIIPPLAIDGPCLTIRKFADDPWTMDKLLEKGTLSSNLMQFMRACVIARKNIVVSGGTGSGKTTFLNCLAGYIHERERIVTIEDTAELQLPQQHVARLETRTAGSESDSSIEVTIRNLVKNSLRMRPGRIIVGECRGEEALDVLQAMNTGHSGSMTTAHANTAVDLTRRFETMVLEGVDMPLLAIREQIATAIDIIVQLQRVGKKRRVTEIAEVSGVNRETGEVTVNTIYYYDTNTDQHWHNGYIPACMSELTSEGGIDLAALFET